jgi:protein N-terminal methyltransferase
MAATETTAELLRGITTEDMKMTTTAEDLEETFRKTWHRVCKAAWAREPASDSAMANGSSDEFVAEDVRHSRSVVSRLVSSGVVAATRHALDCGAGIGRVTRLVLLPAGFERVHLFDQEPRFVEHAREAFRDDPRVVQVEVASVQEFAVAGLEFDLIWVQWVALFLADSEVAAFLHRCKSMLSKGGAVVLKECLVRSSDGFDFLADLNDGSVVRNEAMMRAVIAASGMTIVEVIDQPGAEDYDLRFVTFILN